MNDPKPARSLIRSVAEKTVYALFVLSGIAFWLSPGGYLFQISLIACGILFIMMLLRVFFGYFGDFFGDTTEDRMVTFVMLLFALVVFLLILYLEQ